jgi:Rrf2 family protein
LTHIILRLENSALELLLKGEYVLFVQSKLVQNMQLTVVLLLRRLPCHWLIFLHGSFHMNITAKTRYGIKALLDIAYHHSSGPVQRRQIGLRQGIPTDYMDQILLRLKSKGLITSLRGRDGGYHLGHDPSQITLLDVVTAVEDEPYNGEVPLSDPGMAYATKQITDPAWDDVMQALRRQFRRTTLAQMLEDAEERLASFPEGSDINQSAATANFFSQAR